jgi:hypothetical protein
MPLTNAKETDMKDIKIASESTSTDFYGARRQAVSKAGEILSKPVIIAWKDDKSGRFGPDIPGGVGNRWHDYGENYGGKLELEVGDDFHFIFSEASDFEEPDLNLTSIQEHDGTSILCVNNACTDEDLRKMGHFAGGGVGG